MSEGELIQIKGGVGFNASIVNALVRFVNSSLELGRTLGTIIRRSMNKNMC